MVMLLCIPICGFLWAYGGAQFTSLGWRRVGCGITIALLAGITYRESWSLAVIPLFLLATSIGYGRPDSNDEGSPLGRFWFWLLKTNTENRHNMSVNTAKKVDIATRATFGFGIALSLFPLISIGTWIVGAIVGVILNVYISVYLKPNGMTDILLNEEILIGASWGLAAYLACL